MKVIRQSPVPRYHDYRRYKRFLRVDFCYRCAFCGIHERAYGHLSVMTIDHFKPKSRFPSLLADYGNLYYCCGECNTIKDDTWPTETQLKAGHRFVDVCADVWSDHLELRDDVILGRTRRGKYTAQHVGLARPQLTERNRSLRLKEAEARTEIQEIRRLRAELASVIDTSVDARLARLEAKAQARLREVLKPDPLPE